MISSGRSRFEIAEHGINPVEAGHAGALALGSDDFGLMAAAGLGDGAEAGQSIGDHGCRNGQMELSPGLDFGQAEGLDPGEDHTEWMSGLVGFDSGNKGHLVLRAAACLSTGVLPAEIGVIRLDTAIQFPRLFPLRHDLQQLVFDAPGSTVAHAHQAHQFEGRKIVFGLSQKIHSLEPLTKRELGYVEDRPAGQRRLLTARAALERLHLVVPHHAVLRFAAARAHEPHRPAHVLQRRPALHFGFVVRQKQAQAHPRLKLNPIHLGHRRSPLGL